MVDFLRPAGRWVVEVGPGGGVLTRELLAGGARVAALELDRAWAFALRHRQAVEPTVAEPGGLDRLAIACVDALEIDWSALPRGARIAGNLPYNVATPLIDRAATQALAVDRMAFLVQLELAQRLVAEPGQKAYSAWTAWTACWASTRILGRVKPGSFRPPPRVDSAFVGLERRGPPLPLAEMENLRSTIRAAFSRRRKTLRNALGSAWGRDAAREALAAAAIEPSRRAETLSVAEFVALERGRRGPPSQVVD